MALNLKNPHTLAAVDALAALTGEGKSEAVGTAVEERLARVMTEHDQTPETPVDRLARARALVADAAPRFASAAVGPDHRGELPDPTDVLYDEAGLPA
jgi:antitoxin VapB